MLIYLAEMIQIDVKVQIEFIGGHAAVYVQHNRHKSIAIFSRQIHAHNVLQIVLSVHIHIKIIFYRIAKIEEVGARHQIFNRSQIADYFLARIKLIDVERKIFSSKNDFGTEGEKFFVLESNLLQVGIGLEKVGERRVGVVGEHQGLVVSEERVGSVQRNVDRAGREFF
ncbi:hypothetical protein BpHYR1_024773 [Brachionus plicatilis]|uniref:Uncharacterized protein n=1 Tax=Brachionus plicatilis TaxID=10195 RepID=A0A3M7S9Y0_BRAPC|nr:hypothetical protein BpHYR1_024773 [Brachionus plicatilis]